MISTFYYESALQISPVADTQETVSSTLAGILSIFAIVLCQSVFIIISYKYNYSQPEHRLNEKHEHTVNSAFHLQQGIDFPLHGCYTAA